MAADMAVIPVSTASLVLHIFDGAMQHVAIASQGRVVRFHVIITQGLYYISHDDRPTLVGHLLTSLGDPAF
jgi:hypothetical protein